MAQPERLLADSPADFDSSLAYALHAEMRRLLIVMIVGSILLPTGLMIFFEPSMWLPLGMMFVHQLVGLVLAIVGAAFFYGGAVAILFKIVTDATIIAATHSRS